VVAPVWAARLCIDEAEVRTARSRGDDRALAVTLVDRGLQDAQRLGAAGVERRAVALEQRLRSLDLLGGSLPGRLAARSAGVAPARRPDAAAEQTAEYRFEGDVWCISNGGAEFRLADSLGMRHLARLLSDPGRAFAAIELVGAPADRGPGGALEEGLTIRGAGRDGAGPALDDQAKRAYRERIVELREELDEADAFHDPERAASARSELDFLAAELAAAVGLGGRDRPTGSSAERARVNATRAIRRAITRIAEHDPGLGRELDAAVRTGALCSYDPPPHLRLQWRVELPAA